MEPASSHNQPGQAQSMPVTISFPASSTQIGADNAIQGAAPPPAVGPPKRRSWAKVTGLVLLVVFLLAATNGTTYSYAYRKGTASQTSNQPAADKPVALSVPQGATIISQCAKNRGTQYVLPSNIPHGPVFNVYKGKVIGLEYMVGKDDLADNKDFLSLPLYNAKFDHMNIGLLSKGHAGYPDPHYHVDLFTVSPAESAAITCQ